jgi:hypothetical protein
MFFQQRDSFLTKRAEIRTVEDYLDDFAGHKQYIILLYVQNELIFLQNIKG